VLDVIPSRGAGQILVLGRTQRVVDAFARRRLELLGEQPYTVTTPTKKFRWMVWIKQQAQIAGEASIRDDTNMAVGYN